MCRVSLKIASLSTALFLLLLLSSAACTTGEEVTAEEQATDGERVAGGEQVTGDEQITIADIASDPAGYEGKAVTLSGEYRGWEPGYGSPPVTRSDWVLRDETGGIYVTGKVSPGLDPVKDRGEMITVHGVVRVKDGQAYIEAK